MATNVPFTNSDRVFEDTFCIYKRNWLIAKTIYTIGDKIKFCWKIDNKHYSSKVGFLLPSEFNSKINIDLSKGNDSNVLCKWSIESKGNRSLVGFDTLSY